MKEKIFLIVIFLIILSVVSVSKAQNGDDELDIGTIEEEFDPAKGDLTENPGAFNDPSNYPAVLNNPSFTSDMSGQVLPQYIKDIPKEKVNPALVQDKTKLTSEQLTYGDNIDLVDWSELDPTALADALKELGRINDLTLESPTTGTVSFNQITIPYANKVRSGQVEITNGNNIVISGDTIKVESAPIIEFFGISNEEVNDFEGNINEVSYTIDQAGRIKAGCFEAKNIDKASVTLNHKIEIQTENKEEFNIIYGFQKELKYTAKENNALIADPAGCLKQFDLEGTDFTLEIPGERTDIIDITNSTIITIDRDLGFICAAFTPLGVYTSKGTDPTDLFSLIVAKVPHTVCAKRHADAVVEVGKETTLVDYLTSKITINGLADYRRYFYKDKLLLSTTTIPHYTPEQPFSSILAHDGGWEKTSAETTSSDVTNTVTFSNFVKVKDVKEKRYLVFNPNINTVAENVIHNYKSITHPFISVQNTIVIQDTYKQAKITVLPPGHPDIESTFKTFTQ